MDLLIEYIIIALSSVLAVIAVKMIYFKVLVLAKSKNLVDNPDARKLQKRPVPILGGVAVYFGFIFATFMGSAAMTYLEMTPVVSVLPVVLSLSVMLYVGAMDDLLGLTPTTRFMVEILSVLAMIYMSGGCIDSLHGQWGIGSYSWYVAVPLTVFASVGIINAINMIDGVNGLSSGLCITCCCMFGVAFLYAHDVVNAMLAFVMAGALVPFVLHNVFGNKSKMFIGDAGTMMLGMLMSWFVICLLRSDGRLVYTVSMYHFNMVALAIAILSVPVADTLRVMTARVVHGFSPFRPDKTHLHHIFIRVGVSHVVTAISEILIDVFIVFIWYVATVHFHAGLDMQLYVVVCAAMVFVWGTYYFVNWHADRQTRFMNWLTHISLATQVGDRRWWLYMQCWLDKPARRRSE